MIRNRRNTPSSYNGDYAPPSSEMREMKISGANGHPSYVRSNEGKEASNWSRVPNDEPSEEEYIAAEENVNRLRSMAPEQRFNEWVSGAPDLPSKDEISSTEHTASMSLHFTKKAGSDEITPRVLTSHELAKVFAESSESDLASTFIFPSEIKAEVVKSDLAYPTNLHCETLKQFSNHYTDSGELVLMPVYPTDEINGKVSQSPFVITDTSPVNSEHYELFSRYGRLTPEKLESEVIRSKADPSGVVIPQKSTVAAILKLNAKTSGSDFTSEFAKDFSWNLHTNAMTTRMSNIRDILSKYRKAHASVGTLKSFSLADGIKFELKRELDPKTGEHKSPSAMDSEVSAWTGTNGGKNSRIVALDRMDEESASGLPMKLHKSDAHAVVILHMKYKKVHTRHRGNGGDHHHHKVRKTYYEHHEHHSY